MDESYLYRKIAETIRQEILSGSLKPGDRLPPVREMAARWGCTIGTVQHAYQELARQSLVTSRAGQGTRVAATPPLQGETALRWAALIHRAEAFLLEVLTGGYSLDEVDRAMGHAMDRWRAIELEQPPGDESVLRFAGSHDLVITWLAGHFLEVAPGYSLQLRFSGSLGGLIALAEGQADLAGSHLWDEESDTYNAPFVRRLLPGRRVALVTLAHRRIGLILPEGNPRAVHGLPDLQQPGLRFANRQNGSGTRVWLDAALRAAGLPSEHIQGYTNGLMTHSAVAQAVAEGQADAGIGLHAAALSYGLDFLPLTSDRYDLVIPAPVMELPVVHSLLKWLSTEKTVQLIHSLGGYNVDETGQVVWIE